MQSEYCKRFTIEKCLKRKEGRDIIEKNINLYFMLIFSFTKMTFYGFPE